MRHMQSGGSAAQANGTMTPPHPQHHRRSFMQQMPTMQAQQAAQYGRQPFGGAGGPMMANSAVANRKKRRFADKMVAPEIRALMPELDAYVGLLSYEQKLDAIISRKKMEIQEALKRPLKIRRKLRIYISHSFIQAREPEREGDEGVIPMWELRVEGQLLEVSQQQQTPDASVTASVQQQPTPSTAASTATNSLPQQRPTQMAVQKRKFSSFFKSLVIELDKNIYGPDNHLVEWHRTPQTNETDGFQVKRPGNMDVKCTILLLLDHQPMKFKLHPRLAKLLGISMETRAKIIEALWQYIKTHKLQDSVDHDVINCDHFLEQSLLQQPDPLIIHHVIRWDGAGGGNGTTATDNNQLTESKNTMCYDVDVELDDPIKQQQSAFLQSNASVQELIALDHKIYNTVEEINELKLRRDFFASFAENPQAFVEKWLISQSKDLKNLSETSADYETERRANNYFQPNVQEGVFRYIYAKIQQRRFELEATLGVRNN
uniref:DM2 domain-containing protein n=1 Tax=Globodera rostochiensis TaxID=31243 RepID=A0A914GUT1_GLORO